MLKLRDISTDKLASSSPNIVLLAVTVALMAFIGYKMWQEYLIHQINEMTQAYPTAAGGIVEAVITWEDDATNEDGYLIERRSVTQIDYELVDTIAANTTSYTDSSALSEGEYCYRIGAFNQSGTAYSDDACIYISEADPDLPMGITIMSEFGGRPGKIELDGREFYSFKSDYNYNDSFSIDEVNNLDFIVNKGNLRFKSSKAFVFKEQGETLDNGFARMKFSDLNSFGFTLQGSGQKQVATLYLSFGAWGGEAEEDLALNIEAGETTHLISLPSKGAWHFVTIDISFDELAQVNVTPVGRKKGKGAVRVAGVVLNNPTQSDW